MVGYFGLHKCVPQNTVRKQCCRRELTNDASKDGQVKLSPSGERSWMWLIAHLDRVKGRDVRVATVRTGHQYQCREARRYCIFVGTVYI